MKILLFGGAFDPPHKGHISILKAASQHDVFDKIIVMPTGTPTHKKGCIAPFDVRFQLAKQAFGSIENTEVSNWEGTNLQDNYTYFTLNHLKEEYPDSEIYMLVGSDSLLSLDSWRNAEYVMNNCKVLAFAREHEIWDKMEQKTQQLKALGADIHIIRNDVVDISSSGLRNNIDGDMLAADVHNTIDEYNIYSENEIERLIGTSRLLAKLLCKPSRYIHTLNVEKLAVELGKIYRINTDKLRIAALLHDIMKAAPKDILLHRAKQSDIINRIEDKPEPTLHGFAAAHYAQTELGITDGEILMAIKSHTCGRYGMQDMEKIIYLADMLCEERSFPGKDYLLSLAKQNLNTAMAASLKHSLEYVRSQGGRVDTDSEEALRYFKELL